MWPIIRWTTNVFEIKEHRNEYKNRLSHFHFDLYFQTAMHLVSPAWGPTPAPAPAAERVRGWRATAIVCHRPTSARPTSTKTRMANATRVTNTATGAQVPEKPSAWAATRGISCSVSRVCFPCKACEFSEVAWEKLFRHLWLVFVVAWPFLVFVGADGTCVDECPPGYHVDESGQRCEPCHPSCDACVGKHSHECLACKVHLFREGKECVKTCQHR